MATGALAATSLVALPGTASANGDCVSYWGGSWSGAPAAGGTGTAQDPYKVGSETDLSEIRWCPDKHFIQVSDVALQPGWTPILGEGAAEGQPFSGHYNGAGHAITGLSINLPGEDNVGLFRIITGGRVTDVSLPGVSVTGGFFTGALAGTVLASAEISKVSVDGTITGTKWVGGFVGYLSATPPVSQSAVAAAGPTVTDAAADVILTAADGRAGGIAGQSSGATIEKTATSGSMSGTGYVGGIVGEADSTTLTDLATDVAVTAPDFAAAGGIAGEASGASVLSDSAAAGTVQSPNAAGGLVGLLGGTTTITDMASDVAVTGEHGVGGLVGRSYDYPTITRSVAAGAVSGTHFVGGLLGNQASGAITLTEVSASGAVSGTHMVGGLAGSVIGAINRSTASGSVTATGDDAGGLVGVLIPSEGACGAAVCSATPPPEIPSEIRQSHASGAVQARTRAGSLVGLMADTTVCPTSEQVAVCAAVNVEPSATVYDSYATGAVTATQVAGGLIGSTGPMTGDAAADVRVAITPVTLTIANSYSTGVVTGATRGGVVGDDPGEATVIETFWDATANPGLTGAKGVGKTQAQLRDIATFATAQWLIQAGAPATGTNVWGICVPPDTAVNSGYPFLLWQHKSINPCHPVPAAPVLKSLTPGDRTLAVVAELGADGGKPVTQVQYRLDSGEWTDSGGSSGSFTIAGLTNGTTYKVRVRAINAIGASEASNELSGTPTAAPVPATTVLKLTGKPQGSALPVDERSVLVRSVRTNGRIVVARVFCTLKGNRLPPRLRDRLCAPDINGPVAAAGTRDIEAAATTRKKKLRITARPACSTGLRVHVKVAAKATGAQRKVVTRSYKVDNKPKVQCRIRGTG